MKEQFIHNFDLSVILPFFRKLELFRRVLPHNAPFFARNGIEVLVVADEPSEQAGLLQLIRQYPWIDWRVMVNTNDHEWRNPATALNVGINQAAKRYVMVMSPESEFHTDVIYILRRALEFYENHFAYGRAIFADLADDLVASNTDKYESVPYGSLAVRRDALVHIRGYSEQMQGWGGDDDNLRARLEYSGVHPYYAIDAVLIHREEHTPPSQRTNLDKSRLARNLSRSLKQRLMTIEDKTNVFYPRSHITNGETWGKDFDEVVYDWQNKTSAGGECGQYLRHFEAFNLQSQDVFERRYGVVALVQAHNEAATIVDFLRHLEKHCDGIVFVDDGSEDGTYDLAQSDKILVKVRKKRVSFNDLENRNVLLSLGYFFNAAWFYFIDVDERFDERYADFSAITQNSRVDVALFRVVNLWDQESSYRTDYPNSKGGIRPILRMFRNVGRMQIISRKKLHFAAVPYIQNVLESNILLKHYGMLTRQQRLKKYQFYQSEDVEHDQASYDHLIDENVSTASVDEIVL
jgi:glycosyltransferase involved in cell wall biosynthesis